MKKHINKFILFFLLVSGISMSFDGPGHYYGAWTTMFEEQDVTYECVKIYTPDYYIYAIYESETHNFKSAGGGTWELTAKGLVHRVEFDSSTPENVGKEILNPASNDVNGPITTNGSLLGKRVKLNWIQLDKGDSKMFGAWRITQRERNGDMNQIELGPRRTMKVLSATRFQWAAYNIETKEFMGTGGGAYTAEDGVYTENIEFFSRDNSRVGAELKFNFELEGDDWHHKGLSSRGTPIYEVWSLHKQD